MVRSDRQQDELARKNQHRKGDWKQRLSSFANSKNVPYPYPDTYFKMSLAKALKLNWSSWQLARELWAEQQPVMYQKPLSRRGYCSGVITPPECGEHKTGAMAKSGGWNWGLWTFSQASRKNGQNCSLLHCNQKSSAVAHCEDSTAGGREEVNCTVY